MFRDWPIFSPPTAGMRSARASLFGTAAGCLAAWVTLIVVIILCGRPTIAVGQYHAKLGSHPAFAEDPFPDTAARDDDPFDSGDEASRPDEDRLGEDLDPLDDPFAPAPTRPLTEEERKRREERRRRDMEALRHRNTVEARRLDEQALRDATSDCIRATDPLGKLDAALILLESKQRRGIAPPPAQVLMPLLKQNWPRHPGESNRAMFDRLLGAKGSHGAHRFGLVTHFATEYEALVAGPWPGDWRPRRAYWARFLAEVFDSASMPDPAMFYRGKVDLNVDAQLYRNAYLAVVRVRLAAGHVSSVVDMSLLRPLYEQGRDRSTEIQYLAEILLAMKEADVSANSKEMGRLEERLIDHLRSETLSDWEMMYVPGQSLWWLYYYDRNGIWPQVLRTIRDYQPPDSVRMFLRRYKIMDDEEIRRLFFHKRVSVRFHEDPISLAVDRLAQQVLLPVWVDETLVDDKTNVTLSQTGPWIEVLDSVLKPTKYRAVLLSNDIVWIGQEEKRAAAQRFLQNASGRVPGSGSLLEVVLYERSSGEFIETPADDVIDYLSDLHAVEFLPLSDMTDLPVTRNVHELPLCLALGLYCEDCGLDWAAMEDTIVVGTPEQMGGFREFCSRRRRRDIRLQSLENLSDELGDSLSDPTCLEFDEIPLGEVLDFLCDLHSVHIMTAPEFEQTPVSCDLKRANFGWALSLLLFRAGLTWDTDGDVIYVGTDRGIAESRQRVEGRRKKRAAYPREIADKLTKPIRAYSVETTLAEVVAVLAETSGIRIEIASDQLAAKQLTLMTGELPLDVVLDLICLRTNATWRLEGARVVLSPFMANGRG